MEDSGQWERLAERERRDEMVEPGELEEYREAGAEVEGAISRNSH